MGHDAGPAGLGEHPPVTGDGGVMTNATKRLRSGMAPVLVLVSASFLFFPVMAWVHDRTNWRPFSVVFIGGNILLACTGIALVAAGFSRGRATTPVIGVLIALLPFLGCGLPQFQSIYWVGYHTAPLTVRVVDAGTGQPVPDAAVKLSAESTGHVSQGRTDAAGEVQFSHGFFAYGSSTLTRKTGFLQLWREKLQVEAAGYKEVRVPLEAFTDSRWDMHGPPLPVITVAMEKE